MNRLWNLLALRRKISDAPVAGLVDRSDNPNLHQVPQGARYWEGKIGRFGWLVDVAKVHHGPTGQVMSSYMIVWGILFSPFGFCWFRTSSLRAARLSERTLVDWEQP